MGTSGSLVKLSNAWANLPTNLCHLCVSCILCCWVILVHYTAKYLASYGVQWRLLLLPCNELTFFLTCVACEGGLQFLLPVNIVIIWTFSAVLLWHSVASSSPAVLIDKWHCDIWHNVQVTSCLAATHSRSTLNTDASLRPLAVAYGAALCYLLTFVPVPLNSSIILLQNALTEINVIDCIGLTVGQFLKRISHFVHWYNVKFFTVWILYIQQTSSKSNVKLFQCYLFYY